MSVTKKIFFAGGVCASKVHSFMPREQSKYWCFTLNNPTEEELDLLTRYYGELESGLECLCTYIVLGFERGDQGTEHVQGYVEFGKRFDLLKVKRFLGHRVHLERRLGTAEEAATYCRKDGEFLEAGVISKPQSGRRTDLESIRLAIRGGTNDATLADQYFGQWIFHRNAFREYRNLIRPQSRDWITECWIIWGITGTGKSRLVHSVSSDLYVAFDNSAKWFDGYNGQADVLFDDFEGDTPSFGLFLRLVDRYPLSVPIKGGSVPWVPRRVFFTSNLDPAQWWSSHHVNQRLAWERRITGIIVADSELTFSATGECDDPRVLGSLIK